MKVMRYTLLAGFLIFTGTINAQTGGSKNVSLTLPTVALLDIEPSGTINMSFSAPTEAGRPLTNPPLNQTKWINYTSAISPGGNSRSITASINQTVPGIDIKLLAAASSSGAGALGTPAAQVTLTTSPVTIISGIGGAYTGSGTGNGHRLTITVTPNNYADLSVHNNTQVVVTCTILSN
ncbi:hypothetical protein [Niabella aquatica]